MKPSMRLYANVKSERASKGQGGNDYITIELRTGSRTVSRVVARITLKAGASTYSVEHEDTDHGEPNRTLQHGIIGEPPKPKRDRRNEDKGEKEKGANVKMPRCIHGYRDWNCPKCIANIFK